MRKSDFITDKWGFSRLFFFSSFSVFYYWRAFDTLVELHLQRVGLLALAGFTRYNGCSIFASASLLIRINRQLFSFITQSVVIYPLHPLHRQQPPPPLYPSQKSSWFRRLILSCFYHFSFSFPSQGGVLLFFYLLYYPAWRYLSMLLRSISVVVDVCVILSLVIPSRDSFFSYQAFGFPFSFVNHLSPSHLHLVV